MKLHHMSLMPIRVVWNELPTACLQGNFEHSKVGTEMKAVAFQKPEVVTDQGYVVNPMIGESFRLLKSICRLVGTSREKLPCRF